MSTFNNPIGSVDKINFFLFLPQHLFYHKSGQRQIHGFFQNLFPRECKHLQHHHIFQTMEEDPEKQYFNFYYKNVEKRQEDNFFSFGGGRKVTNVYIENLPQNEL